MEITTNTKELQKALKNINLVAGKDKQTPLSDLVLFELQDQSLKLSCFCCKSKNHDTLHQYTEKIQCDSHIVSFSALINAKKIEKIVKKFDEKTLKFSVDAKILTIRGNGIAAKIPVSNDAIDKYKSCFTTHDNNHIFSLKSGELQDIEKNMSFAIGENDSRKNLMGLNFKKTLYEKLVLTGGDSFRICRREIEIDSQSEFTFTLPKDYLKIASKTMEEDVNFSLSDNMLRMSDNKREYTVSLIEAEYPNLERLLNIQGQEFTFENKNMIRCLDMALEHYEKDLKGVVKLSFINNGIMNIITEKRESGDCSFVIDCEHANQEPVGVNCNLLLEAMKIIDPVCCFSAGPNKPLYMVNEKYTSLLMPVRIQW